MDKYIFLTTDIHIMGGVQSYVAGKSDYLNRNGYDVSLFFIGRPGGSCVIKALEQYSDCGIPEFGYPPYLWPYCIVQRVIRRLSKTIGDVSRYDRVIIESHDDATSQWGELLAARLHAKHFCLICNERFRGRGKFFKEKLDFYSFKLDRKEIAGIKNVSLVLLFQDFRALEPHEHYTLPPTGLKAVQDVEDARIEQIRPADYVICYIGRITKSYVPNIIRGMIDFSRMNADKAVEIVFVGAVGEQREGIEESFAALQNVSLVFLGDMFPIPQKLFELVDVVIAGSGSARCAASAGALTLVAAADNHLCNGLFGYDTQNNLYHDLGVEQTDFCEALCNVLLKRSYAGKAFHLPSVKQPDDRYREHLDFLDGSEKSERYYDEKELCRHDRIPYFKLLKLYVSTYLPRVTNCYLRMRRVGGEKEQ